MFVFWLSPPLRKVVPFFRASSKKRVLFFSITSFYYWLRLGFRLLLRLCDDPGVNLNGESLRLSRIAEAGSALLVKSWRSNDPWPGSLPLQPHRLRRPRLEQHRRGEVSYLVQPEHRWGRRHLAAVGSCTAVVTLWKSVSSCARQNSSDLASRPLTAAASVRRPIIDASRHWLFWASASLNPRPGGPRRLLWPDDGWRTSQKR